MAMAKAWFAFTNLLVEYSTLVIKLRPWGFIRMLDIESVLRTFTSTSRNRIQSFDTREQHE
jgi:hypothetical protein